MARIESLSRTHDRARFDCGVPALNDYLQKTAIQHQDKGIARSFVLVDNDTKATIAILGYFSLTACEARSVELPPPLAKKLPRTIPAVLLGRLAVDMSAQGKGIGGALLVEAIRLVVATSQKVGVAGLFVDAKDDNAASFYQRFGFSPLPDNPLRLFLPLQSLVQLDSGKSSK